MRRWVSRTLSGVGRFRLAALSWGGWGVPAVAGMTVSGLSFLLFFAAFFHFFDEEFD
jgi:hypothetical protein